MCNPWHSDSEKQRMQWWWLLQAGVVRKKGSVGQRNRHAARRVTSLGSQCAWWWLRIKPCSYGLLLRGKVWNALTTGGRNKWYLCDGLEGPIILQSVNASHQHPAHLTFTPWYMAIRSQPSCEISREITRTALALMETSPQMKRKRLLSGTPWRKQILLKASAQVRLSERTPM